MHVEKKVPWTEIINLEAPSRFRPFITELTVTRSAWPCYHTVCASSIITNERDAHNVRSRHEPSKDGLANERSGNCLRWNLVAADTFEPSCCTVWPLDDDGLYIRLRRS